MQLIFNISVIANYEHIIVALHNVVIKRDTSWHCLYAFLIDGNIPFTFFVADGTANQF